MNINININIKTHKKPCAKPNTRRRIAPSPYLCLMLCPFPLTASRPWSRYSAAARGWIDRHATVSLTVQSVCQSMELRQPMHM
jgi:hypothetical protein